MERLRLGGVVRRSIPAHPPSTTLRSIASLNLKHEQEGMKTVMKSLGLRCCALLSLAVIFGPNLAYAAPGSLDPTFGQGGKVVSSFGSPIVVVNAALQSDGKIVVLFSNDLANFALVRFQSNGSLDTNFGSGGVAQTIFANFNFPESVAIQSDGKIVVTGIATNNEINYAFVAARFNANGSLDSTFGVGGQTAAAVGGLLAKSVSLIQPDGKILLVGAALFPRQPARLAMARFDLNGSPDSSFGINGTREQISPVAFVSGVAINAAGNILVEAGSAIAAFDLNGGTLPQVTPAAIAASSHNGGDSATAFQPDGRFVWAKSILEGNFRARDSDTQVLRFTATGAVDPTFNSPVFDFSGEGGSNTFDTTAAVAILPNGQIVLGASHADPGFTNEVFALARLNANGSLDPTFGSRGIVTTNVGGVEGIAAILVQPDGKIIAVGTANNFADVALTRYLP
jgi:uncharacterized delta-60 repeat protein